MKSSAFFIYSSLVLLIAMTSMSFTSVNWRNLGTMVVNYRVEKDVLNVQMRDGKFDQLKFVVKGGTLNMHKVVVYYENGGRQEIEVRHNFDRNSDSRAIDLKGNNRFIEKIEFWYDTQGNTDSVWKIKQYY